MVSVDPVYHENQHWFAKWMADRDSGQNVRAQSGYEAIYAGLFENLSAEICTDRLRIPYSHCVIVAEKKGK